MRRMCLLTGFSQPVQRDYPNFAGDPARISITVPNFNNIRYADNCFVDRQIKKNIRTPRQFREGTILGCFNF